MPLGLNVACVCLPAWSLFILLPLQQARSVAAGGCFAVFAVCAAAEVARGATGKKGANQQHARTCSATQHLPACPHGSLQSVGDALTAGLNKHLNAFECRVAAVREHPPPFDARLALQQAQSFTFCSFVSVRVSLCVLRVSLCVLLCPCVVMLCVFVLCRRWRVW